MLRAIVLAALIAGLTGAAHAEESIKIDSFKIGEWDGAVYGFRTTGKITSCIATAPYRSGMYLTLGVGSNLVWSLGVSDDRWNLRVGQSIPIHYQVDNGAVRAANSRVITSTSVLAVLPDNINVFNEFRRGYVLRVQGSGDILEFALTKTAHLLTALVECVKPRSPPSIVKSDDLPTTKSATAEGGNRVEAMAVATEVLQSAGFKDFRFLRGKDVPVDLQAHDAVWGMAGGAGTLRVLPEIVDMSAIKAQLIAAEASACKGKFASGSKGEEGGAAVVVAACETEGKRAEITYIVSKRTDGGHYVFALILDAAPQDFTTEEPNGEEMGEALRQAAIRVVN